MLHPGISEFDLGLKGYVGFEHAEKTEAYAKKGTNWKILRYKDEHSGFINQSARCLKSRLMCLTLSWLKCQTDNDFSASAVIQNETRRHLRVIQLNSLILYPRRPRPIEVRCQWKQNFRRLIQKRYTKKLTRVGTQSTSHFSFKG